MPQQRDASTIDPTRVRIHYQRPPDRLTVFEQHILLEREDVIVTFLPAADVERDLVTHGRTILEPGAPIVWFTFPERWHDIGRFHTSDGTFTGWYANVLSPVNFITPNEWETRDLCLDVWLSADGDLQLLDEDEFAEARAHQWITEAEARHAQEEAQQVMSAARRGEWPPPITQEWTLERAKAVFCDTGNARSRAV